MDFLNLAMAFRKCVVFFSLLFGSVGRFFEEHEKLKIKFLPRGCSKHARYFFSIGRYNFANDPFLNTASSQNLSRDHEPHKQFFCHILSQTKYSHAFVFVVAWF